MLSSEIQLGTDRTEFSDDQNNTIKRDTFTEPLWFKFTLTHLTTTVGHFCFSISVDILKRQPMELLTH